MGVMKRPKLEFTRLPSFLGALALGFSLCIGWSSGVDAQQTPGSGGADSDLPELGSAANAAITLEDEYGAGLMYLRQMREANVILEDPEVEEYIQDIGHRLSSHAEEGQHQFTYFVIKDPTLNAFAIPGGFIFMNSGLLLITDNENELAGVLSHETAHVTQRHIARGIMDQSKSGLISTAAMLAAILLGATAGRGSPNAMEGAVLATQGAAIQHQINYTRSQEFEADRVGIYTMAAAGFDPLGMPDSFVMLERNSPSPDRIRQVEFLIDHPVTADRIAEAHNRAAQIGRIHHEDSLSFGLMRERVRSLVGDPHVAVDYYNGLLKNGAGTSLAERYGRAVAYTNAKDPGPAIQQLQALLVEYPKVTQLYGALGQAYLANGQTKESAAILEKALGLFPRNIPLTIRLAETDMHAGDNKRAHQLLLDLFDVVEPTPDQARLIAKAANAAGDIADSYYYLSDYYIMNGDLQRASAQLQLALELPGLNPIQRARFSALLEEVRTALARERKTQVADDNGNGRH
jgi:predicted Zn-dependent protease